jgi:hypothetical protein
MEQRRCEISKRSEIYLKRYSSKELKIGIKRCSPICYIYQNISPSQKESLQGNYDEENSVNNSINSRFRLLEKIYGEFQEI